MTLAWHPRDTRVTFAWRSDGGFNSDWSRHERVTQASRACHASVTRVSRKRHVSTMWSVSNCYLAWRARDTRVTCAWRARKVVDKTDGIYLSAYNIGWLLRFCKDFIVIKSLFLQPKLNYPYFLFPHFSLSFRWIRAVFCLLALKYKYLNIYWRLACKGGENKKYFKKRRLLDTRFF